MKRLVFAAWRGLAAAMRPSKRANVRRLAKRGGSAGSFRIREAVEADIPALVRAHVAAWRATHAPLLIQGPGHEVRERQWREAFAKHDPHWFCFVVERDDGEIVGFAQANLSDHPEYGGELNKIYLLRDYQRLGLGRRLVGHVARRFLEQGINSMWLFSDARNPSSRAWVALGATKTDDDPGTGNYGWKDLSRLAAM